jgi:hypothetical protein
MKTNPAFHPVTGLSDLIVKQGITADLLLCPGDLGDRADEAGIQYAWRKIQDLGVVLNVKQIISTVGNHDLDSRYTSGRREPSAVLKGLLPSFPVGRRHLNDAFWANHFTIVEGEFWRVIVLNTCALHGRKATEIERGVVAPETIAAMRTQLEGAEPKAIGILLCHHHPIPLDGLRELAADYDVMENGGLLLEMLQTLPGNQWIIIHGHKHHRQDGGVRTPCSLQSGNKHDRYAPMVREAWYGLLRVDRIRRRIHRGTNRSR